jgi:hypothetical protein
MLKTNCIGVEVIMIFSPLIAYDEVSVDNNKIRQLPETDKSSVTPCIAGSGSRKSGWFCRF